MYCSYCGRQLPGDAKFCGGCGKAVAAEESVKNSQGKPDDDKVLKLVGYSEKINDPAFAQYLQNSNRWSLLFAVILAVIAFIGFPIYGEVSGELEMPNSLYYGMGIGGMFILIALFQVLGRKRDSTWDGVVVDKRQYEKSRYDKSSDTYSTYTVFEYKVKRDNGKIYAHRTENDDTVYNYYTIGDRVRHHKGLGYEKYDKSKDTFLFCAACASINDVADEVCFRCKCPLLK